MLEGQTAAGKLLLQAMPYALPFQQRLGLFRRWIEAEKCVRSNGHARLAAPSRSQSLTDHLSPLRFVRRAFQRPDTRPTLVKIRRGFVLEDGLATLSKLPAASLKGRLVIVFVSEAGHQESGIDSGGLLREFVYEMVARRWVGAFAAGMGTIRFH